MYYVTLRLTNKLAVFVLSFGSDDDVGGEVCKLMSW
jgi:hypothetical protein